MNNPFQEKKNLLFPIILGAAAAAGITYLFATDKGAELRGKISDSLEKGFDDLKDNLPEDLTALKDKVIDSLTSAFKSTKETVEEQA